MPPNREVLLRRSKRPPMMCPNERCDDYRKETKLMGGCVCGTALVPYAPPEPTNKQLENLCAVLGIPVWPGWFDRNEQMRQGALNLHSIFCKAAVGDVEARASLQRWMRLFGSTREASDVV